MRILPADVPLAVASAPWPTTPPGSRRVREFGAVVLYEPPR